MDPGFYQVNGWWKFWQRTGWIKMERKPDAIELMWTSSKYTHNLLCGPAVVINIKLTGHLNVFMETAVTLWIKWGYDKQDPKEYARGVEEAEWMIEQLCNNSTFRGM